ncbi:PH domain-containing protein [Haloplanus halophilus]|uniref:PH domain-containing protein n=1 Tax=Haloplanus halophilus TaxID=2949993 RepID=UPI00203DFADB|nr:PH domain-containing protein [Haloplanus sp. GDY1]
MNRLHPRVRVVWAGQAAVTAAVVGALVLAVDLLAVDLPLWLPPAAFVVVLALGVGLALARYRVWRYEVRDDALYLERGVFTRVRTVVPFVRLQHVDSSRGPVERLVGLASTVVYTAGSRGADVTIPGLTPAGADDLRERLKRLAIRAEGEDAV